MPKKKRSRLGLIPKRKDFRGAPSNFQESRRDRVTHRSVDKRFMHRRPLKIESTGRTRESASERSKGRLCWHCFMGPRSKSIEGGIMDGAAEYIGADGMADPIRSHIPTPLLLV